jgi:prophage tail gpP-like protein
LSDVIKIEADDPANPANTKVLDGWLNYEVISDMMSSADSFILSLIARKDVLDFFRTAGHKIRIFSDDSLQMTGIVDAVPTDSNKNGTTLTITGRDFGGLLTDAAAPMLTYDGLSLSQIAEKLIEPWSAYIPSVITDNAANRYMTAGITYRKRTGVSGAPAPGTSSLLGSLSAPTAAPSAAGGWQTLRRRSPDYRPINQDRQYQRRSKAGDRAWDVIYKLAQEISCHLWFSAAGELVLARPLYSQQSPYPKLFLRIDDEGNTTESNCKISMDCDIGDRYANYTFIGQGSQSASSIGKVLSDHNYSASDYSPAFWIKEGNVLQSRLAKDDVIAVRNVKDTKFTRRLGRTKMEANAVDGYGMTIEVPGHRGGADGPLWSIDTVVDVEYGPKKVDGMHYIRGRTFRHGNDGLTTTLNVIPVDIWLALDHDAVPDSVYAPDTSRLIWW